MRLRALTPLSIPRLRSRFTVELRAPSTRHTTVTFAGNVCRLGLGFISSVLIARVLGPNAYGLIALVSVVLATADTIGDFGLTFTAVRGIARHLEQEPARARELAQGYFSLALIGNTAAALLGIVLAEPIARLALGRPDAEPYLRLALLGLIVVTGSGFVTALLQALRRFNQLAALQILTALTNLIALGALAWSGNLSVSAVILVGVINPILGFVVGLMLLPRGFVALKEIFTAPARRAWRELAAFGKWLWASAILSLLASQLDLVLLSHYASGAVIGIYALAFNLAQKLDIFNQTRFAVLLPNVSVLRTRAEMTQYARASLKRSLVLAAALVLLIPFFQPFILTFYGSAYADAVTVLIILTVVVVFDLATSPLILLGFPLNQPRELAVSDVVRVGTMLAVGWMLIPAWGPVGAAFARLASRGTGAAFMLTLIALRLGEMDGASASG